MAKALDYFALSVLLLISTFLVGSLIFDNIWLALVVAGALSLATIVFLKSVSKGRYKYNPQLLATEFCIQGNEYVAKLLASILKNGKIERVTSIIDLLLGLRHDSPPPCLTILTAGTEKSSRTGR